VFVGRTALCGLATGRCGFAACFGASTVMLGSWAGPVLICDSAVLLRLNSNAVDRSAIAEGATKFDDLLMTIPHQIRDRHPVPMRARYHTYTTSQLRISRRQGTSVSQNDGQYQLSPIAPGDRPDGIADHAGGDHIGSCIWMMVLLGNLQIIE